MAEPSCKICGSPGQSMARILIDIAAEIRADYPIEANSLRNIAAQLHAQTEQPEQ